MLEIACFNVSSALTAINAGADQIELCANYQAGGVTPPIEWVRDLLGKTDEVPIKVMIRPRGGNFNYTHEEFSEMKDSITRFKRLVQGLVFGILDAENRVDEERNRELIGLADGTPCTFHRAIDETAIWSEAVSAVFRCGFRSILSNGGANGAPQVKALQSRFSVDLTVILGGGVRSSNIERLKRESQVDWMHSSAITGPKEEVEEEEIRKMKLVLARMLG